MQKYFKIYNLFNRADINCYKSKLKSCLISFITNNKYILFMVILALVFEYFNL